MVIYISFSEWFKRFTGGAGEMELNLSTGSAAIDAALAAGIPKSEVGFITVNDTKVDEGFILTEGDKLRVYPLMIGG